MKEKNNNYKKTETRDVKDYFEKQTGFIAGTNIQYQNSILSFSNISNFKYSD